MGFDLCGLAPSHAMRLRPLTALARKAPPWGVAGRAPTDWRPRALRVRCASAAKQQGPLLVSPSGAPLTSSTSADGGPDLELSPENAAQVLQSGNPFLLLVGELDKQVTKKVAGLRKAAQGRLPLVRLNCSALPQVCEALQIVSSPTLLLMAKGQA
ncbi:Hypothetical protein SCF082_LOCUS41901, partial [Durusdinium trenchii]